MADAMAKSDSMLKRIEAFNQARGGGVVIQKAAKGYSLFREDTGKPVARLRPDRQRRSGGDPVVELPRQVGADRRFWTYGHAVGRGPGLHFARPRGRVLGIDDGESWIPKSGKMGWLDKARLKGPLSGLLGCRMQPCLDAASLVASCFDAGGLYTRGWLLVGLAILDKSQKTEKYSEADFLVNMGIPVQIDAKHAIAHNKIMVIDGQTVITGSFNFTKAAEENNAENLLVIRSPELAAKYTANWKVHADHSDPYQAKAGGLSGNALAESAKPAAPAAVPVTEGYVASKNSAGLPQGRTASRAATISAKNLIRYNTREEAIAAGKKPCHECNP